MYGTKEVIIGKTNYRFDFIENTISTINDNKYYIASFTSEMRQFVEWIVDPPYNIRISTYRCRNDKLIYYQIRVANKVENLIIFDLI